MLQKYINFETCKKKCTFFEKNFFLCTIFAVLKEKGWFKSPKVLCPKSQVNN